LKQEEVVEELWTDISMKSSPRGRVRFENSSVPVVEHNTLDRFLRAYSFEDPSEAHEIWVELPADKKETIDRMFPEAAYVMEQADEQMRLMESEIAEENDSWF